MNERYQVNQQSALQDQCRPSDVPPSNKMPEVPAGLMHVEQVCGALSETAIDIEQRLQTVLRQRDPAPSCGGREAEPDPQKVSDRLERAFQRLQGVLCHLREILERLEL